MIDPQPEVVHAARQLTITRSSWALEIIAALSMESTSVRVVHAAALIALDLMQDGMEIVKQAAALGSGPLPTLLNAPEYMALRQHPDF
ncbi:MAG: hypothetical protein ABI171_00360 [Collimonas sp.]|uniref:hypothetical protein n=1 Tax=Collimonas sp. TaxID=1963772 RepID=UPI003267207C